MEDFLDFWILFGRILADVYRQSHDDRVHKSCGAIEFPLCCPLNGGTQRFDVSRCYPGSAKLTNGHTQLWVSD